jgi:hypothetical protein
MTTTQKIQFPFKSIPYYFISLEPYLDSSGYNVFLLLEIEYHGIKLALGKYSYLY